MKPNYDAKSAKKHSPKDITLNLKIKSKKRKKSGQFSSLID